MVDGKEDEQREVTGERWYSEFQEISSQEISDRPGHLSFGLATCPT